MKMPSASLSLIDAAALVSTLSIATRSPVIPAQAGIQRLLRDRYWIPACAGMTVKS